MRSIGAGSDSMQDSWQSVKDSKNHKSKASGRENVKPATSNGPASGDANKQRERVNKRPLRAPAGVPAVATDIDSLCTLIRSQPAGAVKSTILEFNSRYSLGERGFTKLIHSCSQAPEAALEVWHPWSARVVLAVSWAHSAGLCLPDLLGYPKGL